MNIAVTSSLPKLKKKLKDNMDQSRDKPLVEYSDDSGDDSGEEIEDNDIGNSSDAPPGLITSFDLRNLLNCEEGFEIKEYYSKYEVLSPKMAKRLCMLIVNHLFDNKIPGSRPLFKEISNEISMVFMKEDPTTYYLKQKGDKNPSGMLYTAYYNEKRQRKLRLERREAQKRDLHGTSVEPIPDEPDATVNLADFTEEIQESVRSLFNDETEHSLDESTVCEHWEISYSYRRKVIQKEMYGDADKILEAWPHLFESFGSSLINIDFKNEHGKPTSTSLVNNWNSFFEKKLNVLIGLINNPEKRKTLSKALEITDENNKNIVIEKSLHYLISPGSKGHTNKWLPSMPSSERTIYKFVQYSCMISVELDKRVVVCKERNLQEHPLIFGVGENKDSIDEFIVAFKNVRYTFNNFLLALDAAFKIYHFFGIDFPHESTKVWVIINELFYKLNMKEKATGKLNSIVRNLLL